MESKIKKKKEKKKRSLLGKEKGKLRWQLTRQKDRQGLPDYPHVAYNLQPLLRIANFLKECDLPEKKIRPVAEKPSVGWKVQEVMLLQFAA